MKDKITEAIKWVELLIKSREDFKKEFPNLDKKELNHIEGSIAHLQTLLSMAKEYVDCKGFPEEKPTKGLKPEAGNHFFNQALHLCKIVHIKEIEKLKKAICPDGSITDTKELVDFAKDLQHAYDKLCNVMKMEEEIAELKAHLKAKPTVKEIKRVIDENIHKGGNTKLTIAKAIAGLWGKCSCENPAPRGHCSSFDTTCENCGGKIE